MRILLAFLSSIFLMSCIKSSGDSDDLRFIANQGSSGLINYVQDDKIVICLSGSSSPDWVSKVQKAVLAWIEPLRALTSTPLAKDVEVVPNGTAGQCHAFVRVVSGAGAETRLGDRPTVTVGASGYYAGYNVLLHELGHAFGLLDTYYNGQSGACQSGQPQSVMCNTSFDTPQADDIKGITQQYAKIFGADNTTNVSNTQSSQNLSILLTNYDPVGKKSAETMFATSNSDRLLFCLGDAASCKSSTATTQEMTYLSNEKNLKVFRLYANFSNLANSNFTLLAVDSAGNTKVTKSFRVANR